MQTQKRTDQETTMTSLDLERRRICYLHAIYAQNPELPGEPARLQPVGMLTMLVTPFDSCFTFCGPDAIRLGLNLLSHCDLVVTWGFDQLKPALACSDIELSCGNVPVLDLYRLIASMGGQEQSFQDVYNQTLLFRAFLTGCHGGAESLTPDDHSALFTLGRMEACRRLNEDACRKLLWLHRHGGKLGCFFYGPEGGDAPNCVFVDWRQMRPCG